MAFGIGDRKFEVRKSTGTRIVELGQAEETSGEVTMEKKTRNWTKPGGRYGFARNGFPAGRNRKHRRRRQKRRRDARLSFNEVLRRNQQSEIDSASLTVYAVDEKDLYGKDIQCAAMKELTRRTEQKS